MNLEQSVGPTVDNLFNSPVSEPGPTKIPSVIGTRKPNTTRLTFFSQNNCRSLDAQEKYQSRASQLYRAKLEKLAIDAVKTHGNKLTLELDEGKFKRDQVADFFEEHTESGTTDIRNDEPVIVTT
ncbi:uncharacterized protein DC041_0002254, partial [Schistosoma bovis]